MLEDLRSAIENDKVVLLLTTDYSAAFPSIEQRQFCIFCREANFSDEAVLFIYDYLTRNYFFISANGRIYLISSGIKQGSEPSPVLFIDGTNSVDG